MIKKSNLVLKIFLLIFLLVTAFMFFNHFYEKSGNLSSLNANNNYMNCSYSMMTVTRINPSPKQDNPQNYLDCSNKTMEILNYLNSFKLTELSSKKNFHKKNLPNEITHIILMQTAKELKNNTKHTITISFFDYSTFKITDFFEDFQTTKNSTIIKYYEINDGNIDFNHIDKILDN